MWANTKEQYWLWLPKSVMNAQVYNILPVLTVAHFIFPSESHFQTFKIIAVNYKLLQILKKKTG